MAFGVLYWGVWRIVLPKVFGYALVPRKETLDDGTVITLVRLRSTRAVSYLLSVCSFLARKSVNWRSVISDLLITRAANCNEIVSRLSFPSSSTA